MPASIETRDATTNDFFMIASPTGILVQTSRKRVAEPIDLRGGIGFESQQAVEYGGRVRHSARAQELAAEQKERPRVLGMRLDGAPELRDRLLAVSRAREIETLRKVGLGALDRIEAPELARRLPGPALALE